MNKKVAFYTLGCKLNFAETSTIARSFAQAGYLKVEWDQDADIYVINTCTVTDNADKRFRSIVRSVLRQNPHAYIVAVGCYAQTNPDEISRVDGVDLVLGTKDKFKIVEHLGSATKDLKARVVACDISEIESYQGSYSLSERTRAFLKIQDGCDYKCTYCTIPLARGRSRSQSMESVIQSAEEIVASGTYEIVLTGVNTGDWGRGLSTGEKFYDMVKALDEVEGLQRVRISSIEPNLITDDILEFIANSNKFVPHFHIPLQSGSDTILKAMKRRYLTDLYANKIAKVRDLMPDACIGADVIVGFPGETDELFKQTYDFIDSLELSYLHVFTYSERENTLAVQMDGVVSMDVRAKRSKSLHLLGNKKRSQFYQKHLGQTHQVLFEAEEKDGYLYGFTRNYIKVKAPFDAGLINTLQNVSLIQIDDNGDVDGQIVS